MEIHSLIIHRLSKQRGTESTLLKRNEELPVDERAHAFLDALASGYDKRSGSMYGHFDPNTDSFPFQNMLHEYIDENASFVTFTHRAMDHYQVLIDEEPLATGGYAVFAHYTKEEPYFICAMLRDTESFGVDEETLELLERIHLDLSHLQLASRVNIARWTEGEEPHLSFARGTKDVSQYFENFIGCTTNTPPREASRRCYKAIEDYMLQHDYLEDDRINVRKQFVDYGKKKIKERDPLQLNMISALVDEANPDRFRQFASSEDYMVDEFFKGHRKTFRSIEYFEAEGSGWTLRFKKGLLNNEVFEYREEENELVLHDPPRDLVDQFANGEVR